MRIQISLGVHYYGLLQLDNPANKFELNGSSNRGSSTSNFTVVDLVP